jgi:hypothetical protein
MKKVAIICCVFLLFSCNKKNEKEECTEADSKKESKFEMYKMSEMAALMEQMYVENQRLKKRILSKKPVGKFPDYYSRIHSAKFTDDSDNDAFFKEQADNYIEAQKLIYSDSTNAKEHFNAGVDACLKCHEQKCGGPIPKIKKLYIK